MSVFFRPLSLLLVVILVSLIASCVPSSTPQGGGPGTLRIVAIGPPVTETIFALGAGQNIVGRDKSSTYPEDAQKIQQVGYMRALNDEGILSVNPSVVILVNEAGPPNVIEKLKASGVEVVMINNSYDLSTPETTIRTIANTLGKTEQGEELIKTLKEDLATVTQKTSTLKYRPRVLFINARSAGAPLFVSGKGTMADFLIQAAGGQNATQVESVKQLSAEAIVETAPEVLLIDDATIRFNGGLGEITKNEILRNTPAVLNKRVYEVRSVDMFGLGPRAGKVLLQLHAYIHPAAPAYKLESPTPAAPPEPQPNTPAAPPAP